MVLCAQCGSWSRARGEAKQRELIVSVQSHVFSLRRVVGNLAHVHSTQGMTGAAEIDVSSLTSYAAGSKATTSGDETA